VNAKVLLVDDDVSVRESLGRVLESEGYGVVAVAGSTAALERLCSEAVDLVLLDINMPIINGWDAFEQMRAINPFLPVIVITARPHQQDTAAAVGVTALMEKPLMLTELLGLMEHVLTETVESRRQRLVEHRLLSVAGPGGDD